MKAKDHTIRQSDEAGELKALVRGQGRSLLIVSPTYGPVHRWIAVLTDMKLPGAAVVANQCGDCALRVEECPAGALKLVDFNDHPAYREDVLDIDLCRGDDGCVECITVCPWRR